MIQFNASKFEIGLIDQIADRAKSLGLKKLDTLMDVEAAHSNGCPLKLDTLLAADDFNFAHDILGIRAHLDRETGELRDLFCPRFAA